MSPPLIVRSTFNFAFVFFRQLDLHCISIGHLVFLDSVENHFKVNLVNVLCQNSSKSLAGVLTVMHVIGIQLRFININSSVGL